MICEYFWQRNRVFDRRRFLRVREDVAQLLASLVQLGVPIVGSFGEAVPVLCADEVSFGFGAVRLHGGFCLYPPFRLFRSLPDDLQSSVSDSCRVGYRPFELAVQCCLIVAAFHLGEAISVGCDGSLVDWHEAMCLCRSVLGYAVPIRLVEPC